VAAVLVMFDRALFQFDWFTITLLHEVQDLHRRRVSRLQGFLAMARPFWRLALRLMISLAIAYTLSVFAELAAFDSAIRERLTAENYTENTAYRDKLALFDKGLDQQQAALTQRIARLEDQIDAVKKGGAHAQQDDYDLLRQSAAEVRTRIAALEGTIAANEKRMGGLEQDIYSERYGLKDKPYRTGKPGCEPGGVCHDMVLTVKELRDANGGGQRPDHVDTPANRETAGRSPGVGQSKACSTGGPRSRTQAGWHLSPAARRSDDPHPRPG
jgi:hypothetical protein